MPLYLKPFGASTFFAYQVQGSVSFIKQFSAIFNDPFEYENISFGAFYEFFIPFMGCFRFQFI